MRIPFLGLRVRTSTACRQPVGLLMSASRSLSSPLRDEGIASIGSLIRTPVAFGSGNEASRLREYSCRSSYVPKFGARVVATRKLVRFGDSCEPSATLPGGIGPLCEATGQRRLYGDRGLPTVVAWSACHHDVCHAKNTRTCDVVIHPYRNLHHPAVTRRTSPRRARAGAADSQNELVREPQRTTAERGWQVLR